MPINDLVQDVFIDPIKSVLFVDDEFPTYASLIDEARPRDEDEEDYADDEDFGDDPEAQGLIEQQQENGPAPARDPNSVMRAYSLTSSCRKSGFIFDVESSPANILGQPNEFINKPDLIVLDYILEPETLSESKALQILKVLDETARFNLVVLNTTESSSKVLPVVARLLRGKISWNFPKDIVDEAAKVNVDLIKENMVGYLSSSNLSDLATALNVGTSLDKEKREDVVKYAFESYLQFAYDVFSSPDLNRDHPYPDLECSSGSKECYWVRGKNVFVAIVQKTQDNVEETIDDLIEQLKICLIDYRPSPINMLLRKGLVSFRSSNAETLQGIFRDEKTRAGLLYHTLTSDHPQREEGASDVASRVSDLTKRAFNTLSESVHTSISDMSPKFLEYIGGPEGDVFAKICDLEKLKSSHTGRDIALALNAFLCSTAYVGEFFTNGVVFRSSEDVSRYWVCASPSCDMFPRKKSSGYRGEIYPAAYFEALQIEKVESEKSVKRALKDATKCKHIFLNIDGECAPYKMVHGNAGDLLPFVFYSTNKGFLNKNKSKLQVINSTPCTDNPSCADISLKEIEVEVVGILRSEYADRFLHSKGSYNSRIGVDFIPYSGD